MTGAGREGPKQQAQAMWGLNFPPSGGYERQPPLTASWPEGSVAGATGIMSKRTKFQEVLKRLRDGGH